MHIHAIFGLITCNDGNSSWVGSNQHDPPNTPLLEEGIVREGLLSLLVQIGARHWLGRGFHYHAFAGCMYLHMKYLGKILLCFVWASLLTCLPCLIRLSGRKGIGHS